MKALFTAPTAIRAIKKEDPDGTLLAGHDLSALRTLFLAGERLDPDTYHWASERLGVPVDRPLVADRDRLADRGQPARAGADADQGRARRPCRCPGSTCGCSTRRRRARSGRGSRARSASGCRCRPARCRRCGSDDERYVASYLSAFAGYYLTGDGGYVDEDGYLFVMGRTDDVINVAGHRLSTGSLEAVLAGHPAVAECAVIGVYDELKGQVPRGLVVLKAGVDVDPDVVTAELVQRVRDEVGAVASLQAGRRRAGAAQDPVRQDPAQDDARARRRPRPGRPEHDRGRRRARRAAPVLA